MAQIHRYTCKCGSPAVYNPDVWPPVCATCSGTMTHTLVPEEPTEEMIEAGCKGWYGAGTWKYHEHQPEAREVMRDAYKAILAAAPEPDAVVLHFHHATTPPVKPGSIQSFIVLTEREGRKASFAAYYLNQYPLAYEDGCEAPECAEGKHEDGCPTTGWFYDESNFEYDHCYYRLKGTVLAWAPIPKPDEIFAEKASDNAVKALVEAAKAIPHHDECDLFVLGTECSCYKQKLDTALRPFLKGGE